MPLTPHSRHGRLTSMPLGESLRKLLEIAGPPLSAEKAGPDVALQRGSIGDEIRTLLEARNGFYAFESALLFRPSCPAGRSTEYSLEEWNDSELWVDAYMGLVTGCFFFAEDLFGSQFCARDDGIFAFDPETGECNLIATDLDGWAREILADYEVLTGHPLAHAWQKARGKLPPRKRLVPKIPFVLGGAFELENMYLADSVQAMRSRANIARQIIGHPDGTSVRLVVDE